MSDRPPVEPAQVADSPEWITFGQRRWPPAWRIAAIYGVFASLWIYFSDHTLRLLISDATRLAHWKVYNDISFVAVSVVMLLWLLRGAFAVVERSNRALQANQSELERLTRLYAALSQVNQAIVSTATRNALFDKVCQVLVEHGGFHMAWIAWHDPKTRQLVPVAQCGDGSDYAKQLVIYADDRPEGRGPTGTAFRENRPCICNDLFADPMAEPWRAAIKQHRLRASAVFPIQCEGTVCGTLNVYADESGFFHDKEIALLTGAAADISFGLDNFRRDEERTKAEQKVRQERDFSEAMLNSLPGVLYFYDQSGRFLRWNKNFETVTGYNSAELATMHPLDFFSGDEKDRVAARIADVFAQGSSSVEAKFLTKEGEVPYYFTGVMTQFDGQPCLVGVGIDITARKQAEIALRASEERFNAFMDATPTIAWITDAKGRHLFMNHAWSTAFGLERSEWIGKTAADLVSPEKAEEIRQSDQDVLEQDRVIEIPADHGTLQGKPYYWDCIKFPFRNAAGDRFIGGIALDITERKQAEDARRESEERYRALFEQAPDGILIADGQSRYLDANPSICRMLGYTRENLIGRNAVDIVVPEELTRVEPAIETIKSRTNYHREWNFKRSDGTRFPAEVIAALMPDGNILAMIRDITERKRAEAALRELNETLEAKVALRTEELEAARARAEAADQIKSAFLATMSHELRTPLNSIIGFTGIVLQGLAGPLNAEQSKQLGMVRSSARHLLELINDVLDISKIEAGQLDVHAEAFDLRTSIDRVAGLVRPAAEKKGLQLTVELAPEIGQLVSDRRRVEQILLNLLNNAVKFTERGHVTLSAAIVSHDAHGSDAPPQPSVCLRVIDTGIGIKPEDMVKLFQPFRQIDSGLTRSHEGTGLGLAICRRLASLLRGSIAVSSTVRQGSVFTVTLPLRPAVSP